MTGTLSAPRDAMHEALAMATRLDGLGIRGYGVATLRDGDGKIKMLQPFANLITNAGDDYYAKKGIVGISPANASAPTAANGMKLGTTNTAVTKSGVASTILAYISGSNAVFSATYPQVVAVGTDIGYNMVYRSAWAPGVATATIVEAAIVNDQATNAVPTVATTYSRAVLSAIVKAAGDTLTLDWNHKALGA